MKTFINGFSQESREFYIKYLLLDSAQQELVRSLIKAYFLTEIFSRDEEVPDAEK